MLCMISKPFFKVPFDHKVGGGGALPPLQHAPPSVEYASERQQLEVGPIITGSPTNCLVPLRGKKNEAKNMTLSVTAQLKVIHCVFF